MSQNPLARMILFLVARSRYLRVERGAKSPFAGKHAHDPQFWIHTARGEGRRGRPKGSRGISAPWLLLLLQVLLPGSYGLEGAGRYLARGQFPQPTQQRNPGLSVAASTFQQIRPIGSH